MIDPNHSHVTLSNCCQVSTRPTSLWRHTTFALLVVEFLETLPSVAAPSLIHFWKIINLLSLTSISTCRGRQNNQKQSTFSFHSLWRSSWGTCFPLKMEITKNWHYFWMIHFQVDARIQDLYMELKDGIYLLQLLELLSGEQLPKPNKGTMRVHFLENNSKAIQFLKSKVRISVPLYKHSLSRTWRYA